MTVDTRELTCREVCRCGQTFVTSGWLQAQAACEGGGWTLRNHAAAGHDLHCIFSTSMQASTCTTHLVEGGVGDVQPLRGDAVERGVVQHHHCSSTGRCKCLTNELGEKLRGWWLVERGVVQHHHCGSTSCKPVNPSPKPVSVGWRISCCLAERSAAQHHHCGTPKQDIGQPDAQ